MAIKAKARNKDDNLRKLNNILTVLVIGLGLYLVITPFLPQLLFWLKDSTGQIDNTIPYSKTNTDDASQPDLPSENRLVVPQMDLDSEVHDGQYASTLRKGIWHRPQTSTPDKGGNTVMVGHRFTYSSPAIFYHLDKLKADDELAVIWNEQLYTYKVREVKIVNPTEVHIENNTEESILTLYTCTPMWTAKQRLVVISELIDGPNI
ncbi:class E sortase [Candidatus Saccharibacteria bacterium]|nr:class E sortase [Candidatus Saccharibacteria bacterium]